MSQNPIIQYGKKIYHRLIPDHVLYKNVRLPAKYLRYCGSRFKDDERYLDSALNEADRLVNVLNVTKNSVVLDVGCGVGRLAIGLTQKLPGIKDYQGIDVSENAIRWCKKNISSGFPNFHFSKIDMKNELYNKEGREVTSLIPLPFKSEEFDIIYLYSVFSHMRSKDVSYYLEEFRRIIKRDGKIFMTAFLEEGVPDEEENPANYRMEWTVPLHCVRYNKKFFESLTGKAGFRIDRFDYENETDGQSGIYLSVQE